MTLNGIGVWHDAFENRKASQMEYYDIRNALITCAIHNPEHSCFYTISWMWRHMLGQMLRFRTEDQLLTIRAIEDFCQGVDFLKETDTCELHAELSETGYVLQDVSGELERLGVDPDAEKPEPDKVYEEGGFSMKHLISLNGWLLPGRRGTAAVRMGQHPSALYRCRRALLYDPDTAKGFYVTRKRKDLFITGGRLIRVAILLLLKYRKARSDYQENVRELTGRKFWERYARGEN